ncbi:MAG: amidohydrolase family protein, partial [Chloroflexota bacterium]
MERSTKVVIVDSHCHVNRDWFEPVDTLLFEMDRNDVEGAILIQIGSEYDNTYQFECQRRYPGRFASVVRVDPARPTAGDDLARLRDQGANGVRFTVSTRSPGADPLALWRKADELGLPVSCLATAPGEYASEAFAEVIAQIPNLPIVVEHLGAFNLPDDEKNPYPVRRKVFALAKYPNVYLKIHGLGEFTPRTVPFAEPRPFGPQIPPLQQMAYEAFGADRIMWGSDFPPVAGREGYRNALRLPMLRF